MKKPAERRRRRLDHVSNPGLGGLEVRGLGATGVRHDVERDLLAFGQGAHAGGFHRGGVHEYVLAAAFRSDKAEAFRGIEELHGSDSHKNFPHRFPPGGMPERVEVGRSKAKEVTVSSRRALKA